MKSPTQNSLKKLRKEGYLCAITEHWNAYARIRQDLFGFVDILAIHKEKGETLAIQTTSYSNISARRKKIKENSNVPFLLAAGWNVHVHGWKKVKGKWECKKVKVDSCD